MKESNPQSSVRLTTAAFLTPDYKDLMQLGRRGGIKIGAKNARRSSVRKKASKVFSVKKSYEHLSMPERPG